MNPTNALHPLPKALYQFRWKRRKIKNFLSLALLWIFPAVLLTPLILILSYLTFHGITSLNWEFLTSLPHPVGTMGGGIAHAITGSFTLVLMASALAVPWGLFVGMALSEYPYDTLNPTVRFCCDLLTTVPSIVIGIFAYTLIVLPMGHFSAHAGACALALIMLPIIARTTEEILRLLPVTTREAGLALGLPRWKVIVFIVLRSSKSGLISGIVLALARAIGETAPLLFTAFGNQYFAQSLSEPIASLPVLIYQYAISPYEDWHQKAYCASFLLVAFVFLLSLTLRLWFRPPQQKGALR